MPSIYLLILSLCGLALAYRLYGAFLAALVVVNALTESAWAVFTIACTIPIAFLRGQWLYAEVRRPG